LNCRDADECSLLISSVAKFSDFFSNS
jgi:hypothetical protein